MMLRLLQSCIVIAMTWSVMSPAVGAQARDQIARAARLSGSAAITGQVINSDGRPVADAWVAVVGERTRTPRVSMTDQSGHYRITGLVDDRYHVVASKAPYLAQAAGSAAPLQRGSAVVVSGADVLVPTITLTRSAAISGRVTMADGTAGVGMVVTAVQVTERDGLRVPGRPVTGILTDGLGRFRVFDLAPGRYVVLATSARSSASPQTPGPLLTEAEVDRAMTRQFTIPDVRTALEAANALPPSPTFAPGVWSIDRAMTVDVAAGDERVADVTIPPTTPLQLTGITSNPDGAPTAAHIQLESRRWPGSMFQSLAARSEADGQFVIRNIPPGAYFLKAQSIDGRLQYRQPIDVTNDITAMTVPVVPPVRVVGTVAAEPGVTLPRSIRMRSLDVDGIDGGLTVDDKGLVSSHDLWPGRYVIDLPALHTATIGDRDVTDRAIVLQQDVQTTLSLVLGTQTQVLTGTVVQSDGSATGRYTLVLFPTDESMWIPDSRRVRSVVPDSTGSYTFGGDTTPSLPAGVYALAAVTSVSQAELSDTAFLRSLLPAAVRVTIGPGQTVTQDVRVR